MAYHLFNGDSETGGPWFGRALLAWASIRNFAMLIRIAFRVNARASVHTKIIPSKFKKQNKWGKGKREEGERNWETDC